MKRSIQKKFNRKKVLDSKIDYVSGGFDVNIVGNISAKKVSFYDNSVTEDSTYIKTVKKSLG